MKILICEDNKLAMKALTVFLSKAGFETTNAVDGNEAMDYINTNAFGI